ncbi:CvpA family protein [Methanobacterium sp. MZD130B]|uniref:CvpA family protein n=1 Tax=Methanobacterium sp. MZD130B TaxID=3394378 RepID=UPI0039FC7249
MEEESSKVSQEQKTSDEKSSKAVQFNQNTKSGSNKNSFSVDSSTSKTKSSKRFRDFLIGSEFLDSESDSKNKYLDEPRKQKVNQKYEDNTPSKSQEFYLRQEFMKFKIYRHIHSKKEQIIRIIGGLVGVLFIIAGILYLFGGSIRLADSVIYGERAVLSAFSILIGILIIAGLFGLRLLTGTFLKKIHSELEKVEEQHSIKKSSKEKKKSFNEKEKQKNNIEEKDKK